MKVSGRAPSATPRRVISASPRAISAARALSPERAARNHAAGNRKHVLHRPGEFHAAKVVGRVGAERI